MQYTFVSLAKQFRWILHTHKHNLRCHEQHLAWVHQLKKKVKQMHMSNVSHYQILPAAFEMRYSGKWNKNYILEMNIKIMTKKSNLFSILTEKKDTVFFFMCYWAGATADIFLSGWTVLNCPWAFVVIAFKYINIYCKTYIRIYIEQFSVDGIVKIKYFQLLFNCDWFWNWNNPKSLPLEYFQNRTITTT